MRPYIGTCMSFFSSLKGVEIMNKWGDVLYTICVYISRMVYVNLLWILFSVIGLGFFGIGPATLAAYEIFMSDDESSGMELFVTFKNLYKKHFMDGNRIMLGTYVFAAVSFVNYMIIFDNLDKLEWAFISYTGFFIAFVFMFINLFPVTVLSNNNFKGKIVMALFIAFRFPMYTLLQILSIIGVVAVVSQKIQFMLLFFPILLLYVTSKVSVKVFREAKEKFSDLTLEV